MVLILSKSAAKLRLVLLWRQPFPPTCACQTYHVMHTTRKCTEQACSLLFSETDLYVHLGFLKACD